MRLNTPGGTTGTSEEVAMMIENVRKAGVPMIASIADCCCSGGFWIATACDYIFANRTSMVGSVGVIMQLPNFKGLSEKLGVSYYTVKAGKMKDIGNPFREPTEEETKYLTDYAAATHEIFKKAILKNRKNVPDNPEIFDGRPFSVEFALENHLVDEIGTYYDALAHLLVQQGLEEDDIAIERTEKKKSLLSRIFSAEIEDSIVGKVIAHLENNVFSMK
jgi:protease-4